MSTATPIEPTARRSLELSAARLSTDDSMTRRSRSLSGPASTGSADYHGPGHKLFSGFRAFELHGLEPALGPIAA